MKWISKYSVFLWNLAAGLIAFAALYFIWPELLHQWVFRYMILNWPVSFIALIFVFLFRKSIRRVVKRLVVERDFRNISRILTALPTVLFMFGIVSTGMYLLQNYGTYKFFAKFDLRQEHVISSTEQFRYTPRRVAYRIMNDSVNDAAENIEPAWTLPIIFPDGFGYAAPVTPDGMIPIFDNIINSLMVYEDRADIIDAEKRRRRIPVSFKYGPGMQWFDSLERKLVMNDFFAVYDEPHLLAWNSEDRNDIVMAVPKTKYAFFLFPYWAGVTIVHPDGRLEDFSPSEIAEHERLKSQWTFPQSLADRYVRSQNYGTSWGVIGALIQVSGKLEPYEMLKVEPDKGSSASDMPTNQQPFLTQGADGNPYLVIMTKGQGGGSGIFRAYYLNAATGEGTYVEYEKDASMYGPNASMDPVKTVPGYNWRRETGRSVSGNIVVIEPIHVVREKDPEVFYWKGSVVPTNFRGVSATVVAPADKPQEFILFRTREAFEAWLEGEDDLNQLDDAVATQALDLVLSLQDVKDEAEDLQLSVEQMLASGQ